MFPAISAKVISSRHFRHTLANARIEWNKNLSLVVTLSAYMPISAYMWLTYSYVEPWYVHQYTYICLYPRTI